MDRKSYLPQRLGLLSLAISISACQISTAAPRSDPSLAFAQAACGGCHAVQALGLSPNPAAPNFADIANRQGLTRETLTAYLNDAHNYPEVMDFDLEPAQTQDLVEHILALRSESYRKPI